MDQLGSSCNILDIFVTRAYPFGKRPATLKLLGTSWLICTSSNILDKFEFRKKVKSTFLPQSIRYSKLRSRFLWKGIYPCSP